jgi:7-cyano-7-deazaguanine synthase
VGLLSGGLDSIVSLTLAARELDLVAAVTFRYGQKAAAEEVRAAARVARALGIPHRVISLPWLGGTTGGALTDPRMAVPEVREASLDLRAASARARAVWVPNRNALFVNIAASLAEAWGAEVVVAGFNREEAQTFPDNGPAFVRAVNAALRRSTLRRVRVVSYVQRMDKREIVLRGLQVSAPLSHVYSCYRGGRPPCGRCESCKRLRRAFREAGAEEMLRGRFRP